MKFLRNRLSGLAFLIAIISKGEARDICTNYPEAIIYVTENVRILKSEWEMLTKTLPEHRHKDAARNLYTRSATSPEFFKCYQTILERLGEHVEADISLLRLYERDSMVHYAIVYKPKTQSSP